MSRKPALITFFAATVALIIGLVLAVPENFGICSSDISYSCIRTAESFAEPLIYLGGAVLLTSILIILFPATFQAWKRFAIWYLPTVALLLAIYDDRGGGFFPTGDKESTTWFLVILYLIISTIIILRVWWKGRSTQKT
jgi:hypothetical protein